MTSIPVKLILSAVGLAFIVATTAPAEAAKARKGKTRAARIVVVAADSHQLGTNLFRAGPIYNGPDYLGNDPDPFIRSQIFRDLNAFYGSSY